MKSVKLYCDGSCLGNPGPGGWAYILEYGNASKKQCGKAQNSTNNQMELKAAINGLAALKEPCEVQLFTDSSYVANGINSWLEKWVKINFKNKKNVELWKELLVLLNRHKVRAFWIKGHAGHPQNEECDKLARNAALSSDTDEER